jgi:transposase
MLNSNEITNGITSGAEARKQRGLEIAARMRIRRRGDVFIVPSQYAAKRTTYQVQFGDNPTCTCEDHTTRHCRCKHIYAVEFFVSREFDKDGGETLTESVTISKTRKTYSQDWPNYNAAQVNEKHHFQELLRDLCAGISEPARESRRGRPQFPLSDAVFAVVFKVYSTQSGRRFSCDLSDALSKGHISRAAHYNTAFKFIEKPSLYPVLMDLIERSSLPLKSVESQFSVNSTGFAYSRFVRWYDIKYGRFTAEQQWIKAHICCGTHTNVVTAIDIRERDAGEIPSLPQLVDTTAKNFDVKEVSADKGYSSRIAHDAVAKVGAVPFIAFKANTTGGVGGLYQKMFHYFSFNREDFLAHYHRRSNIESTVMMIKSKFGDAVRSKSEVAAKNEVLAKVLCHNICCNISAIYELGIQPVFGLVA